MRYSSAICRFVGVSNILLLPPHAENTAPQTNAITAAMPVIIAVTILFLLMTKAVLILMFIL